MTLLSIFSPFSILSSLSWSEFKCRALVLIARNCLFRVFFLVLFRGLCQPRSPLRLVNRANSWFNGVFLRTQWIHWESWTLSKESTVVAATQRRGGRVRGTLAYTICSDSIHVFHRPASVDDNHDGVITRISRFEPFVQLAIRLLLYQITSWIHLSFYVYIYMYILWRKNGKGERRIIYERKYKYILQLWHEYSIAFDKSMDKKRE